MKNFLIKLKNIKLDLNESINGSNKLASLNIIKKLFIFYWIFDN